MSQARDRVDELKRKLDQQSRETIATARELVSAIEQFRKVCPHQRLIEAPDGMIESCDSCDNHAGNHPARFCEDCGSYETDCPMYTDGGWWRLKGEARNVTDEEFRRLLEVNPCRIREQK